MQRREPARPQVFRHEGDYWTITYDGTTVRLRDAVGVHYLVRLLAHPNQRFAVEELLATVRGTQATDPERARSAVSITPPICRRRTWSPASRTN
jgi:hypothetical protein